MQNRECMCCSRDKIHFRKDLVSICFVCWFKNKSVVPHEFPMNFCATSTHSKLKYFHRKFCAGSTKCDCMCTTIVAFVKTEKMANWVDCSECWLIDTLLMNIHMILPLIFPLKIHSTLSLSITIYRNLIQLCWTAVLYRSRVFWLKQALTARADEWCI